MQSGNDRLLRADEVADRLGVHLQTVRAWLRSGELPGYLLSRKAGYRIRESDLAAFLDQRRSGKAIAA
jgi:excisionase family DNA binding protein